MAMLSLIDSDRQWFKARSGIEATETPRDTSFCGHAIQDPNHPFIVEDTSLDPRFANNPFVTGDPKIGFYAGVPIVTANGHAIGTICVADTKPGDITPDQLEALKGISRQAAALLELRRRTKTLSTVLERERNKAAEYLEWQRTHDDLTALPTRELLERRINQMADAAQLNGRIPVMSVVTIKASGMAYINSVHGREAGDMTLRELAWVLAECLPADALLSRLNGSTFAALVPDADLSLAGAIAGAIHLRLGQPIHGETAHPMVIDAVIGSASSGPGCAISPNDLLAASESAAAEAKVLGPNSTVAAGADTGTAQARDGRMKTALAAAIRSEALTVAYMPLVRMADEAVSGYEALARWRDPDFGQVSPEEFIALAEQHGMVASIDAFVLRTALADFASGALDAPTVTVNVSPRGIDATLADRIAAALDEAGVSPNCLNIEITERAGLCDSPEICAALKAVQQLGVKVALDDFGAGVTSLAHLRSLPITHLKIDRSLVSDLVGPDAERARMVIEAIATMATNLGLEILGEGVEFRAQADALQAAGVKFAQGMLYGAPKPLNQREFSE
jgi:diguanylate cyclase (GGDEF)-like protein